MHLPIQRPSTLSKLTGLPTIHNILPRETQAFSAKTDAQRAPGLALGVNAMTRVLTVPTIPVSPVPIQLHSRLPDSLPGKTLTPGSDHVACTKPYQQSPQSTMAGGVKREADSSVESLLVDRAIENMMSLPDVVGEVALKQKEQTEELKKQQQQLAGATQQLNEEEKKVEKVKEELQSVKRQTWLMEEKAAQIMQQCQRLETDIEGVIHDNTEVTRQLEMKHEALEQDGAVYRESVERMTKHIAQVEALESTCIHNQTLKMQKQRVDTLRQQKQELVLDTEESRLILTGVSVTRIQEDIEGLKTEVLQLDNKMKCSIQQVESEKDRQRQLKQDIQVLQKRNVAQLTRMRRLLKVSQCHNRQWGEQAKQLERTVSALKRQLEE